MVWQKRSHVSDRKPRQAAFCSLRSSQRLPFFSAFGRLFAKECSDLCWWPGENLSTSWKNMSSGWLRIWNHDVLLDGLPSNQLVYQFYRFKASKINPFGWWFRGNMGIVAVISIVDLFLSHFQWVTKHSLGCWDTPSWTRRLLHGKNPSISPQIPSSIKPQVLPRNAQQMLGFSPAKQQPFHVKSMFTWLNVEIYDFNQLKLCLNR